MDKKRNKNIIVATSQLCEKIRASVKEKVVGQDFAIQSLEEAIFEAYTKPTAEKGPKAIIVCLGPPGCGKTESVMRAMEACGIAVSTFDCSRYAYETGGNPCGSDGSYKEAASGPMTEPVMKNPIGCYILDEFDLGRPDFKTTMQGLFDSGYLFDNYEKVHVDFRNVIVIIITNAGGSLYNTSRYNYATLAPAQILTTLREERNEKGDYKFPASMVSRFGKSTVIPYNRLTPKDLHEIVVRKARRFCAEYKKKYDIQFQIDTDLMAKSLIFKTGAVDARGMVEVEHFFGKHLENTIKLIKERAEDIQALARIEYEFEFKQEIQEYFNNPYKPSVAVFCGEGKELFQDANMDVHFVDFESTISSMDYDAVIIDVSSKNPNSMDVIKKLCARSPDVPLCAFCVGEEKDLLFKEVLIKEGVSSFFNKTGKEFLSWLNNIIETAKLIKSVFKLKQKNKVIAFEAYYKIIKEQEDVIAKITLKDFSLQSAISGSEGKRVVADYEIPETKFTDIIGLDDDLINEVKTFVEIFKDPVKARRQGKDIPKGVLFVGPPGVGKTLVAMAIANEANVPIISRNPARDYMSALLKGKAEETLKKDIDLSKALSGILFLDEVDTIAKTRLGHSDMNNTLQNILLTEMQGFSSSSKHPFFVIGATNFPTSELDPAFLQRFDKIIQFKLPSTKDRVALLSHYLKKHKIELGQEEVELLAGKTFGQSGRALARLVRVVKNKNSSPKIEDFIEENEVMMHGARTETALEDVEQTAYHEGGHALLYYLIKQKAPNYLTNIGRNGHAGYMELEEDKKIGYSYNELRDHICILLGGRAAEKKHYGFGGVTTGIQSDLSKARELARQMIDNYGMFDDFLAGRGESDGQKQLFDATLNKILKEEMDRAARMIDEHAHILNELVQLLLRCNSLHKNELTEFFKTRIKE